MYPEEVTGCYIKLPLNTILYNTKCSLFFLLQFKFFLKRLLENIQNKLYIYIINYNDK